MGLDTGSAFAITKSNTLFSSENTPDLVMNLWHTKLYCCCYYCRFY
jgi:hypothetical protein